MILRASRISGSLTKEASLSRAAKAIYGVAAGTAAVGAGIGAVHKFRQGYRGATPEHARAVRYGMAKPVETSLTPSLKTWYSGGDPDVKKQLPGILRPPV